MDGLIPVKQMMQDMAARANRAAKAIALADSAT